MRKVPLILLGLASINALLAIGFGYAAVLTHNTDSTWSGLAALLIIVAVFSGLFGCMTMDLIG